MNDSSARGMNERQPQRPCGCVGIFFQLFDQNRRFDKKLFPKKLLSPVSYYYIPLIFKAEWLIS